MGLLQRALAISIFSLLSTLSYAGPNGKVQEVIPDPNLYKLFQAMYNFQFSKADSLKAHISPLNVTANSVADLYSLWWKGLTYDGFNPHLKQLESKTHSIVGISNQESPNDNGDERFLKAIAGTFGIRVASIKDEKRTALHIFLKIKPTLNEILELPRANEEYMLVAGVYNLTAAGIRKNSFVLRPFFIFLPTSNELLGRELLLECTKSLSVPIATEAHYFLFKIEREIYSRKAEAMEHIKWLTQSYPNNFVFAIEYLSLCSEMDNSIEKQKVSLKKKIITSNLNQKQKEHFLKELNTVD